MKKTLKEFRQKSKDTGTIWSTSELFEYINLLEKENNNQLAEAREIIKFYADGKWDDYYPGGIKDGEFLDTGNNARKYLQDNKGME